MSVANIISAIASLPGFTAIGVLWRLERRNRQEIRRLDRLLHRHELALTELEAQVPTLLHVKDDE